MIKLKALKLEPGCTYALELQCKIGSEPVYEALREAVEKEAARIGVKFVLIGPHIRIKRESIGTRAGLALRAWMIRRGWIKGPLEWAKPCERCGLPFERGKERNGLRGWLQPHPPNCAERKS